MLRTIRHVTLLTWLALTSVAAHARDTSSWTVSLVEPRSDATRPQLVCRAIKARAGVIQVHIVNKAARALFIQDDHGGFFLVRNFETPDATFDPRAVPDSVTIDLLRDVTSAAANDGTASPIPLINRPGRYWLVSTENHETEVENIEWIDACPFTVSGAAPVPDWRLSPAAIPAEEAQPKGLRCHIVDPAKGVVEIDITDKRARYVYVRDDHDGSYLVSNFERRDPHGRSGTTTFDAALVPDKIRIDLFHDLALPFSADERTPPVHPVSRPGDYRIVSADDSDGELSLTNWLGKCAVRVR